MANIAPIHTLPELMSTAGGDGITVILGVQDIERTNAIWPGQGYGIVEGGSQLLLGGYRDATYLQRVSQFTPLVNRYHTNITVDHEALKAIPHRGITTTDLIESATRRARSVERVDPRIRGLCDQNFLRMERANMLMKGQQIGEIGDSFEEWMQHYNSVVSVDHVGTLRHALEPHELFELPDGQALAISGTTMAMLSYPAGGSGLCGGRCLGEMRRHRLRRARGLRSMAVRRVKGRTDGDNRFCIRPLLRGPLPSAA